MTINPFDPEEQKRAIFERLSERRKKYIARIGYDNWDPFQEPKDPIDIRKDSTKRTSNQLVNEFLYTKEPDSYSNAYTRGVLEMAIGIINEDDRFLGMYDFVLWHQKLLKKERLTK